MIAQTYFPGAEGLAEKVQEIQTGAATEARAQDTTGWAPPPGIADPVAIRFGLDAKFEADPGGGTPAVWISRKTILEQLGIRELTPQHRVLGDGFVAVGVADLRCAIKRIHHLAPETPWPSWFTRLYSVSKGGRS